MSSLSSPRIRLPAAGLAAAFLGLGGLLVWRAWPLLFPEIRLLAPLDPACELRRAPCLARFPDGGRVYFSLEPRDLPVLAPLQIEVRLEGMTARALEVDFAGTDMNMGYNRVTLTREDESGRWRGQTRLPVCVREVMGWEARVLLWTEAGLLAAPFRFETDRR